MNGRTVVLHCLFQSTSTAADSCTTPTPTPTSLPEPWRCQHARPVSLENLAHHTPPATMWSVVRTLCQAVQNSDLDAVAARTCCNRLVRAYRAGRAFAVAQPALENRFDDNVCANIEKYIGAYQL